MLNTAISHVDPNFVLDLVPNNDPILTTPCEAVNMATDDVIDLSRKLGNSMMRHGGVGLAANQIGINKRAFVMSANPIIVVINPIILDFSKESVILEEACLSYPGLVVKVIRPHEITVRYQTPTATGDIEVVDAKYDGMTARIFQHEYEHIEGGRFFDVVSWYERERVKRWYKKRKK